MPFHNLKEVADDKNDDQNQKWLDEQHADVGSLETYIFLADTIGFTPTELSVDGTPESNINHAGYLAHQNSQTNVDPSDFNDPITQYVVGDIDSYNANSVDFARAGNVFIRGYPDNAVSGYASGSFRVMINDNGWGSFVRTDTGIAAGELLGLDVAVSSDGSMIAAIQGDVNNNTFNIKTYKRDINAAYPQNHTWSNAGTISVNFGTSGSSVFPVMRMVGEGIYTLVVAGYGQTSSNVTGLKMYKYSSNSWSERNIDPTAFEDSDFQRPAQFTPTNYFVYGDDGVNGEGFYYPVHLSSSGLTNPHVHSIQGVDYYMEDGGNMGVNSITELQDIADNYYYENHPVGHYLSHVTLALDASAYSYAERNWTNGTYVVDMDSATGEYWESMYKDDGSGAYIYWDSFAPGGGSWAHHHPSRNTDPDGTGNPDTLTLNVPDLVASLGDVSFSNHKYANPPTTQLNSASLGEGNSGYNKNMIDLSQDGEVLYYLAYNPALTNKSAGFGSNNSYYYEERWSLKSLKWSSAQQKFISGGSIDTFPAISVSTNEDGTIFALAHRDESKVSIYDNNLASDQINIRQTPLDITYSQQSGASFTGGASDRRFTCVSLDDAGQFLAVRGQGYISSTLYSEISFFKDGGPASSFEFAAQENPYDLGDHALASQSLLKLNGEPYSGDLRGLKIATIFDSSDSSSYRDHYRIDIGSNYGTDP